LSQDAAVTFFQVQVWFKTLAWRPLLHVKHLKQGIALKTLFFAFLMNSSKNSTIEYDTFVNRNLNNHENVQKLIIFMCSSDKLGSLLHKLIILNSR